ncbi:hypothetical protein T06_11997 [Trichinella sp. T6]|nr:hypothetical protein T06_11997 [Trichinella sp. T6]
MLRITMSSDQKYIQKSAQEHITAGPSGGFRSRDTDAQSLRCDPQSRRRNRSWTPTEGDFEGCATWLCISARSRNNEREAGAFDPCGCGCDNKAAAHLSVGRRSPFTTQKYCAPDST